jgi:hypothetical protein
MCSDTPESLVRAGEGVSTGVAAESKEGEPCEVSNTLYGAKESIVGREREDTSSY